MKRRVSNKIFNKQSMLSNSIKHKFDILVIDECELITLGFIHLLSQYDNMTIATSKFTCLDVQNKINEKVFSLIIVDYSNTNKDCWLIITTLLQSKSKNILVFSDCEEKLHIKKLFKLGVKGYLQKSAEVAEIQKAINSVMIGSRYLSQPISEMIANDYLSNKQGKFETLTDREFQILKFIINGEKSKDIAKFLGIQPSTLSTHKIRILSKLKVPNVIKLKEYIEKNKPDLL